MAYIGSTQQKNWTYPSVAEIDAVRKEANLRYCERIVGSGDVQLAENVLKENDEKLILLYFQRRLVRFCQKFKPKMPRQVIYTSLAYFKRFYLRESTMDWHPEDVKYACAYLATKTEEFNISLRQFCANLKEKEREVIGAFIVDFELTLIEALHFELTVHTPLRALGGYVLDFAHRYNATPDTERRSENDAKAIREASLAFLEQKGTDFLDVALYTDAMLIASPSQLALCAFCAALAQLQAVSSNPQLGTIGQSSSSATSGPLKLSNRGWTADSYVTALLADSDREMVAVVSSKLSQIHAQTSAIPSLEKAALRSLKARLKRVRNVEHNPFRRYKAAASNDPNFAAGGASNSGLMANDDDSNSMDLA